MEAETLKTKKQINKGRLKKTLKNVICRPDTIYWPQTSDDEGKTLTDTLNRFTVDIPEFKKPHWSELSHIPKQLRPKPPPIPKVEGLIFGITECQKAIENKECTGVLIESAVNPKTIVWPLIEICTDNFVPVLCLKELRRVTKMNFGIPTSVLAVKKMHLLDLERQIHEISKNHKPPKRQVEDNIAKEICFSKISHEEVIEVKNQSINPYLYRTNKNSRVFIPSLAQDTTNTSNKFDGQNFIQLSKSLQNEKPNSKQFMKMIVKKISSNPNRRKVTKVSKKD